MAVLGYVGADIVEAACRRIPVDREAIGPDGTVIGLKFAVEIAEVWDALLSSSRQALTLWPTSLPLPWGQAHHRYHDDPCGCIRHRRHPRDHPGPRLGAGLGVPARPGPGRARGAHGRRLARRLDRHRQRSRGAPGRAGPARPRRAAARGVHGRPLARLPRDGQHGADRVRPPAAPALPDRDPQQQLRRRPGARAGRLRLRGPGRRARLLPRVRAEQARPRSYALVCARLEVEPAQTVFLDDNGRTSKGHGWPACTRCCTGTTPRRSGTSRGCWTEIQHHDHLERTLGSACTARWLGWRRRTPRRPPVPGFAFGTFTFLLLSESVTGAP